MRIEQLCYWWSVDVGEVLGAPEQGRVLAAAVVVVVVEAENFRSVPWDYIPVLDVDS